MDPQLCRGEHPGGAALPATLEPLIDTARAYARAATSKNTNRAYAADWRDYLRWRARQGLDLKPSPTRNASASIRGARFRREGRRRQATDRRHDRAAAHGAHLEFRPEVPAIRPQGPPCRDRARRRQAHPWPAARPEGGAAAGACPGHARPPPPVELTQPARPGDPPPRLRRRPAPLGDRRPRDEPRGLARGSGWPEFFDDGVLLTLRGKTGWREVEIGRGSKDATCPVAALQAWLKFARIARGPCSGRWSGARSDPKVSTTATSRAWSSAWRSPRAFRRSVRTGPGGEVFRAFAARRARLVGRDRRTLRPEAPRPRLGGNDPPLPAAPRPLPCQSRQGGGAVIEEIGRHRRVPCPTGVETLRQNGAQLLAKRFKLKSLSKSDTLRGERAAVVLSARDYDALTAGRPNVFDHLLSALLGQRRTCRSHRTPRQNP